MATQALDVNKNLWLIKLMRDAIANKCAKKTDVISFDWPAGTIDNVYKSAVAKVRKRPDYKDISKDFKIMKRKRGDYLLYIHSRTDVPKFYSSSSLESYISSLGEPREDPYVALKIFDQYRRLRLGITLGIYATSSNYTRFAIRHVTPERDAIKDRYLELTALHGDLTTNGNTCLFKIKHQQHNFQQITDGFNAMADWAVFYKQAAEVFSLVKIREEFQLLDGGVYDQIDY
jgi:hypothetical protein